jgi:hypothetical protein
VSDLSVTDPAQPGTATLPWTFEGVTYVGLLDAMTFTGQHVTATVDRIHLEGRVDPTNQYFGYNVINALHFTGEFACSPKPWDWYFVSGSFTVRNSSFKTAFIGASQDGFVTSSHITIGGLPTAGNQFEDVYGGIDIEVSEKSVVEISYNEASGIPPRNSHYDWTTERGQVIVAAHKRCGHLIGGPSISEGQKTMLRVELTVTKSYLASALGAFAVFCAAANSSGGQNYSFSSVFPTAVLAGNSLATPPGRAKTITDHQPRRCVTLGEIAGYLTQSNTLTGV